MTTRVLRCLLLSWLFFLAAAAAAQAPAWVVESDENAQILLKLQARYFPESTARQGVEGIDEQILDLKPNLYERIRADGLRAVEELKARRAASQDPLVSQDLDILITVAEDSMQSAEVQRQYLLPYNDVAQIAFNGIRFLLDPQIPKERQAAALVRLERYAGLYPDSAPIAQLARDRSAEPKYASAANAHAAAVSARRGTQASLERDAP